MRRIFSLITFCLLAFVGAGVVPATADGSDNEIGACLAQDKVWLLVVDEAGDALANQCVGNPASGEEALTNAGITLQFGDGRMICTMNGHPETCPAVFDGSYWASYQGAPGKEYTYATVGPAESKPVGGTIEAWCFATAEAGECLPPQLNIVQGGQQVAPPAGTTAVDLPVTGQAQGGETPATDEADGGVPFGLILGGSAVVLAAVGVIVWLRGRRSGTPKTTGGR